MEKKDDLSNYRLKNKWTFWEGYSNDTSQVNNEAYKDTIQQIVTVETMGQLAYVTKSKIVDTEYIFTVFSLKNQERSKKVFTIDGVDKSIEAIGMFKKGISMKWEDPENYKGSDISVRIVYNEQSEFQSLQTDFIDIVAFLINEDYDYSNLVNGIRIVDQSAPNKPYAVKIEFWLSTKVGTPEYDVLKQRFFKEFNDLGNKLVASDFLGKDHQDAQ